MHAAAVTPSVRGSRGFRGGIDNRREPRRPLERNDDLKKGHWESRAQRSRSPRSKGTARRSSSSDRKHVRFSRFSDEGQAHFEQPKTSAVIEKPTAFAPQMTRSWQQPPVKFSPPPRFPPSDFNTEHFRGAEKSYAAPSKQSWGKEVMVVMDEQDEEDFGLPVNSTKGVVGQSVATARSVLQPGNTASVGAPSPVPVATSLDDGKDGVQGPTIPEFNPETSNLSSQEWIKLIEIKASERDWKPDEKLYVLSSRLAGYARQWYLNTGIKCKNWNELKTAFFVAFPSENDYYMLLKKMFLRVKEDRESITSYFHHKVALLNACDIYSRKAVSCIVGGLPNTKMKDDAKLQNFDDPDLLYQYLRTYSEPVVNHEEPKIDTKNSKSNAKKLNTTSTCSLCKKRGHTAAECDLNSNFDRLEREARRFSELASKGLVTNNNVMHGSLSQTPTFSKYFTDVAINGIPLRGYVDTSSLASTIREENASYLKLPVFKLKSSVLGFSGLPITTSGIIEVPICIDRAIANVKLHVVPNYVQVIPIVIGQNFLGQSHIVLMEEGDKVRFYQDDGGRSRFDF